MTNFDKLGIYIPIKRYSSRVKYKNTKEFYSNQSLIDLKLQQLLSFVDSKQIYLYIDDPWLESYAKRYNTNIVFFQSKSYLPSQKDDITRFDFIMRCCVTLPFLSAKTMRVGYDLLIKNQEKFDFLFTAEKVQAHIVQSNFSPLNFKFKFTDHPLSQNLEPFFILKSGMFLFKSAHLTAFHEHQKFSQLKPFIYELTKIQAIDINEIADWEMAQIITKGLDRI